MPTENPYSAVVHTSNQEDVLLTMVDGRILLDRDRSCTTDPEALRVRLQEIRGKIRG